MDREYDPGNANLKKHCILQALLLVIIRFCPIYLLRYWPLFWVYLSTPNWICLPYVFFFRLQRLKYPVYTVAGGFVCAKKVWQTQEGTMNSPSLFLIQSRGILLNFSSSPPPPPKHRQQGSPLFSYRCALLFRFRWPSTLLPCDWLDLRLFWIIACIVYIKL